MFYFWFPDTGTNLKFADQFTLRRNRCVEMSGWCFVMIGYASKCVDFCNKTEWTFFVCLLMFRSYHSCKEMPALRVWTNFPAKYVLNNALRKVVRHNVSWAHLYTWDAKTDELQNVCPSSSRRIMRPWNKNGPYLSEAKPVSDEQSVSSVNTANVAQAFIFGE